jgi:hypothetical protein
MNTIISIFAVIGMVTVIFTLLNAISSSSIKKPPKWIYKYGKFHHID